MVRGRGEAGSQEQVLPLSARPQVVRALLKVSCTVGAAGTLVAGLGQIQAGLLTSAASAAVSAGGGLTSGGGEVADVTELAAPDAPVEVAVIEPVVAPPPTTVPPAAPPVTAPPVTTPPPVEVIEPIAMIAAVTTAPEPGSVEAVITEVFGPHARSAIGVARCESGLNPAAVSRGGGNVGLFQINTVHRKRVANMGFQWEQLLDARVNSLVAKTIFDEQGWRPWACRHAA